MLQRNLYGGSDMTLINGPIQERRRSGKPFGFAFIYVLQYVHFGGLKVEPAASYILTSGQWINIVSSTRPGTMRRAICIERPSYLCKWKPSKEGR